MSRLSSKGGIVMSSDTTTLHKVAEELRKLAAYIDDVLPVQLRDTEIKSFFVLRHQNMPHLAKAQQYIISKWEPRVKKLLKVLDGGYECDMTEYAKLRKWLGIQNYPPYKEHDWTEYYKPNSEPAASVA